MKGMRLTVLRIVLYGICAYAVFAVIVYFVQRHLLYFPDRTMPSNAHIRSIGLRFWPAEDRDFRGFTGIKQATDAAGTVIVFHGNAGAAWNRAHYVTELEPLNYRVLLAEYPGYGGRPGKTCEKEFIADARTTVRLVSEKYGKPIILCGESLGCGVAAGVAADPPAPIQSLILITPWDTLPNLAQTIHWYLPARRLTREKYDNIENLRGFRRRTAVVLAELDEVVPKRHGMNLFQSLSCEKKLWIITGAGHNNWQRNIDVPWWSEVMSFVMQSD